MDKQSLANFVGKRREMIRKIKEVYGLDSPLVFFAMLQVPRHKFVDKKYENISYSDGPVPIGHGQTMSQPYTVAFMTNLLVRTKDKGQRTKGEINPGIKNWRILEIGTGSGYQAAVLSKLVKEVYTLEIVPELAEKARKILKKLKYENVHVKAGSGEWGWEENSPFDAIMVTAGIEKEVPKALFDQLKAGGVLIAPVGKWHDKVMTKYTRLKNIKTKKLKNIKTKEFGGTLIAKEEFGIFHFVPFVEEGN